MKTLALYFISVLISFNVLGQERSDTVRNKSVLYVIIKNDGSEYIGRILEEDGREVLIETEKVGQIYIPKHEIREIRELNPGDISETGQYIPDEIFATRYFISTNGLPIKQGDHYVSMTLLGPEIQFATSDKFGVGFMTSWIGLPVILTLKYSVELGQGTSFVIGSLLGNGTWGESSKYRGALPYGGFTIGNRRTNITFLSGYGVVSGPDYSSVTYSRQTEGHYMLSVGGLAKVANKISLVFDLIGVPKGNSNLGFTFIMPGLRWQNYPHKAVQFAIGGVVTPDGTFPVPMFQWFSLINY